MKNSLNLPEPDETDSTESIIIPNGKAAFLSDLHIPHHDLAAVDAALNYALQKDCRTIVLIGDVADFYAVSYWEKDPTKRNLNDEIIKNRQFFKTIVDNFDNVYYKLGNHEERWQKYIWGKAPEISELDVLTIQSLFELPDHVVVADKMQNFRAGEITLMHGHEFGRSMFNPVNPARGLYLRAKESAVCGHYHQPSYHEEKSLTGTVHTCYTLGCLCNLKPRYRPHNKWSHSFATAEIENELCSIQMHRINNGVIV